MAPRTRTPEEYGNEMSELWTGVTRTLDRLDRLAAEPDRLDDEDAGHSLRSLQYRLHLASEHAYGVEPPASAATAHAQLADALVCARDATGEVIEALADAGLEGARPLVLEWRGALFRVRLARLRLAAPAQRRRVPEEPPGEGIARPLAAFLLTLLGALAFMAGSVLGLWPVWAAGLAAVAGSVLSYRP